MKPVMVFALGLALIASACAPSPEIVATAMAQTETALPTATLTLTPSPTHTLTLTPKPPTSTAAETPTSTPDLRIITANPEELACTKRELPDGGSYALRFSPSFPNHVTHYTNDKVVISSTSRNDLEEYVMETRRIDGWWVDFEKLNANTAGYSFLRCITNKHETAEGARLAVTKYNHAEIYSVYGYELIENPERSIGDISVAVSKTQLAEWTSYEVYFAYRNYQVTIIGDGSANMDDLYYIAEAMLEKLKNAPLGAP